MKTAGARAFAFFSALFVAGFFFQTPADAAKVISGSATKYYIQVKAEKGDSPYSIARMFTDSGAFGKRNPTKVAADFLSLNGIRAYNKKGNPLIYPDRIYRVPTQEFSEAMKKFVANLGVQEKIIAPAAVAETSKSVSVFEDASSFWAFVTETPARIFLLVLLFVSFAWSVWRGFYSHRGKGEKKTEDWGDIAKNTDGKIEETPVPAAETGGPLKVPSLEETLAPLEYPAQGPTLGDRIVNALRPYKMEEVIKALEANVIPVIGNDRSISLGNLPSSMKKHPEWKGEILHKIIMRAESEIRDIRDMKLEGRAPQDSAGFGMSILGTRKI